MNWKRKLTLVEWVHVGLAAGGIFMLLPIIFTHRDTQMYMCLTTLIILFAVGVMSFLRKDVVVKPKNADVLQIQEISHHKRMLPFIVAVGVYFVQMRFILPVSVGLAIIFNNSSIAVYAGIFLTIVMVLITIPLLIYSMDPIIAEITPTDEFRLYYRGKIYSSPIKEVDVHAYALDAFFDKKETGHLLFVESKKWNVLLKFETEEAKKKFYSYLYYRIHPNEYLKNRTIHEKS